MDIEKIEYMLDGLLSSGRLMRDHADELYKLVPDSKDRESPEYKAKRSAGWHGHEVNKYYMHIGYRIKELKELIK